MEINDFVKLVEEASNKYVNEMFTEDAPEEAKECCKADFIEGATFAYKLLIG